MSTINLDTTLARASLAITLLGLPGLGFAQVPVDGAGEPYSEYSTAGAAVGQEGIPLLTASELEELVGPIALYPDDLLAIVLPASTYPLQVVQAGRFLDAVEADPSLEPDEAWDDSVVALLNYPEVVELLNEDLDWTWRLGEAVVAQQADVIAAVESFRDRAYAAGNLKSDAHQTVSHSDDGIIEVVPVDDEIIYVPYYEPEQVVVYQPRPVYYYYPRPYPVYYYPYPSSYAFDSGYFWGVTTAFTIGWYTDRLHVFHHSYYGHPYYGRYYYDRWWYRRPSINIYNNYYVHGNVRRSHDYYRSGDYWHSREHRRLRSYDRRITRNRYYPGIDSGYETRSVSATNRFAATQPRRDYRHKRFATVKDGPSGSPTQATQRKARQTGFERTTASGKPASVSSSRSGQRGTRDKIEFRDRSGTAANTPGRSSRDLRHGLVDPGRERLRDHSPRMHTSRDRNQDGSSRAYTSPDRTDSGGSRSHTSRDNTYIGGWRGHESRSKPVQGDVAARSYRSYSAPRVESGNHRTASPQHDSYKAPRAARPHQTANPQRFEKQPAAASRPEPRQEASRQVKGGERQASRAAARSERRRDDGRSKK